MFRALTILSTFSPFFTPLKAATIYPPVGLSTLDGVVGSEFNGVLSNDNSGSAVAGAGDINGDGFSDFAIGAINALNSAGQVSVIFGSPAGFNAAVDLSTALNGTNGFVIAGESPNDSLGFSIASGDINGDGLSDLVIGAPFAAANGGGSGKVYVIYGTRAGFNATFPLAMLNNSIHGFVIYGVSGNDFTGYSVATGNVNRDGFSDLLIGAPSASPGGVAFSGSGYLVYGSNQTFPSPFQLSTLNGMKGSRFNGGVANYYTGYSVAMGDFNGDGFSDLIIGAPANNGQALAGLTSVVFGTGIGFSATVNLSSTLNGSNGFNLYGVTAFDQTGISVAAGDVNNDGLSEIFIGAANANPGGRDGAGITYVLYGTTTPFNSTFSLASLSGATKGFQINGVNPGDTSGTCVAIAGDINGDGVKDFMIGAPTTTLNGVLGVGTTYIMLGTNGTQNTTVELSAPNSNCLILRAGAVNENSGFSVAGAGDVNGDGLSDVIIGAKKASPYNRFGAGSSDLVYGDSIQLINNQLTISAQGSHILTLSDLNASVPFNPGYTQYTITGMQHGQFEYTDQPGVAIIGFSAQDIMVGRVIFIQDGTLLAPSCFVSAEHTFAATTPVAFNMTFIYQPPSVVYNNIPINQGQTVLVLSSMFSATYLGNPGIDNEITYFITNCSYGAFSPPSSFTYSQVLSGGVNFITFNSINPPQCSFTISLRGAYVGPIAVGFDFDTTPVLDQNHFDICQSQRKPVTSSMLSAIHPGANSSDTLVFSVNNVQYGYFEHVNAPGVAILTFSQAEVQNSSVLFVHDGSPNPPSFMVTVSDGRITTPLIAAAPYFTYAPVITSNTLVLDQGQTTILNSNMLKAVNPNLNNPGDVIFTASNVEGGVFFRVNTTQNNITQFNQSQVTANEIAFRSDGNPPSYTLSAANQCSETPPSDAVIKYNYIPSITANQVTITDGQPVILTSAQLAAIDLGQGTSPGNLVFTVSGVENGYFDATTLPGTQISVFSQQRVFNGEIRFVPKSSSLLPAYNVSVSDGVLSDEPQEALVILKHTPFSTNTTVLVDSSSNTPNNTIRNSIIAFVITSLAGIAVWLGKRYLDKRMNNKLQTLLRIEYSSVEKADEEWKNNTVFPVLKEVLPRIQTATGCCGYRDEQATRGYINGIEKLLGRLKELGVNINLNELGDHERNGFKSAIADEVQKRAEWGKPPRSKVTKCCAALLSASSGPVFTASELQRAALQIAEVVAATYKKDLSEPKIDGIRRPIYDEWTTRSIAKQRQTSGGGHETSLELADLSNPDGEQKFASEQLEQLSERMTKAESEITMLKGQKEQSATSSDGPFVEVGARRAAVENSPSRDTVVTVSTSAPKSEALRLRAA